MAGEKAHPGITEQIRALERGDATRSVVALHIAAGQLVWDKSGPANIAIKQWAPFSAQPRVDPAAQQEVIAAVTAQQRELISVDGSTVLPEAVNAAMSAPRQGAATGPDGLPLLVYKKCKALFVPLLAKVFSTVGELKSASAGFTRIMHSFSNHAQCIP